MLFIFIIFSFTYSFITMMHLDLENLVVEYANPTFYNGINVSMRREDRSSPYYVNMYIDYKQYVGDNLTLKVNVYEVIGGRQILTPLRFEYNICYFLRQDSVAGQIFREQLPKNLTCPFAPGIVIIDKLVFHAEQLPFIPLKIFTYDSPNVKTCTEIECFYIKERVLIVKIYMNVRLKFVSSTSRKSNKNKSQRHLQT